LDQQRLRLPTHKFRRLHLNLPGAPNGAFLDQGAVLAAIVAGRKVLPPEKGIKYAAFVDMSGGSSDDAVLCITHKVGRRAVVDLVVKQDGEAPFNPRNAVRKFCGILRQYGIRKVVGDDYAGNTFKFDFEGENVRYESSPLSKTPLYEAFEPPLNAGEIELPEMPAKLQEQLLTLVIRGVHIDHQPNDHDDYANAVAGAVYLVLGEVDAPQACFGTWTTSPCANQFGYNTAGDHNAGAGEIFASMPPEYWAAQGIFHPNDRQRWIDAGVYKPEAKS
jgi:hypothetical protein